MQPLTANKTVTVNGSFTATRTAEVEWAFHIGGDSVPAGTVFTFDNMSLICTDSDTYDYVKPETWNRAGILTNQVNYFPQLEKKATLLSDQTSSVSFSLLDESGKTVFTGDSSVLGEDADSGDSVHVLDFSKFQEPGTYTLEADGQKAAAFPSVELHTTPACCMTH